MTDYLVYLLATALNAVLLYRFVLWRGWVSFEGLGGVLLLVVIASDFVALTIGWAVTPYPAEIGHELRARVYPTLVHAAGILAVAVGLWLVDPHPEPVRRELTDADRERLAQYATLLIILGLGMKTVSLYVAGVRSIVQYLTQMYFFTVYQAKFGGFLDKGPVIANLGIAVLAATRGPRVVRQVPYVLAMGAVGFGLTTSRADLLGAILTYLVVVAVLNRAMLREAMRHRATLTVTAALMVVLVLLNSGIKSELRVRTEDRPPTPTSLSSTFAMAGQLFAARFSAEGLFDGYSNLVNRLEESPGRFFDGAVGRYTLTAWVPYVIYRDKPQHPFRATGDLIYDDYHSIMEDVSAPTLVGSAYADYGPASVLFYLIVYGVALGAIRRVATRRSSPILLLLWYLHFTHVDGGTNIIHGGILNLIDAFALASGVIALTITASQVVDWARFASAPPRIRPAD